MARTSAESRLQTALALVRWARAPSLCRHARRAARALRRPRWPGAGKHLINGKDIRHGTVTSEQLKDRTITTGDLAEATVAALLSTPDGSITAGKLVAGRGRRARDRRRDGRGGRHRRRRGRLRQARRRVRHRREDRRRLADDGRHRALQRRVPDPRRGPRDDRAHECWSREPRGLAPEPPAPTSPRTRCSSSPARPSTGRPSASTTAPTRATRRGQPLRPDALQPHRRGATPPSIAFSYIVFDLP